MSERKTGLQASSSRCSGCLLSLFRLRPSPEQAGAQLLQIIFTPLNHIKTSSTFVFFSFIQLLQASQQLKHQLQSCGVIYCQHSSGYSLKPHLLALTFRTLSYQFTVSHTCTSSTPSSPLVYLQSGRSTSSVVQHGRPRNWNRQGELPICAPRSRGQAEKSPEMEREGLWVHRA